MVFSIILLLLWVLKHQQSKTLYVFSRGCTHVCVCVCFCVCLQVVVIRAFPPVFLVYDPAKMFLTSKFNYLLLCNPAHKTETGTSNRWELLIANNLDQSLYLANQTQGAAVRSHLSHSSLAGGEFCCACVTSLSKLTTYARAKPFTWPKQACFDSSLHLHQCLILSDLKCCGSATSSS